MLKYILMTLLIAGCKPQGDSTQLLESGGDPATWRVTPTLKSNAGTTQASELRLEKSGPVAADPRTNIARVELQIQNPNSTQLPNQALAAKKWLALSNGSDGLTFNLLMTTDGAGYCYANNTKLNGATEPVFCKPKPDGGATPPTDLATALRAACVRLSATKFDPANPNTFARNDPTTIDSACICRNGYERIVRFEQFKDKPITDAAVAFESACTRREAKPGDQLSIADRNYNTCAELTALAKIKLGRSDVQLEPTACICAGQPLNYDEQRFNLDPQAIEVTCRSITGIASANSTSDLVATMRRRCKEASHFDLGTYCDCREDGVQTDKTEPYAAYKTLEDFSKRLANLQCD